MRACFKQIAEVVAPQEIAVLVNNAGAGCCCWEGRH